MHTYIRLTFWLVFSVVEFVFFGAHIVIMPFEALFDHWGGIGLILDGMKCVILILLGTIIHNIKMTHFILL
jgi:hypothetical protein